VTTLRALTVSRYSRSDVINFAAFPHHIIYLRQIGTAPASYVDALTRTRSMKTAMTWHA
jgi:hypothetical protein